MEKPIYQDGQRQTWIKREDHNHPFLEVLPRLGAEWVEIDVPAMRVRYTNKDNELIHTEVAYREEDNTAPHPDLNTDGQPVALRMRVRPDERGNIKERLYLDMYFVGINPEEFRNDPFYRFETTAKPITRVIDRQRIVKPSYAGDALRSPSTLTPGK
jgi:hypothetical protein